MQADERRVLLTEQNFLGLGPLRVQQGDELCIMFGLATPFVIRERKEGGYFLMGECYIDGLMNGEGLNMGIEQDIVLYWFYTTSEVTAADKLSSISAR